ncbi:3608_t:CDS:2 [Ambispora leptoticha]|uniref:3608_t:CDS:1 n=1 Tax=Ambispora leptoticha TaxID=144679 RepID=A0A9N8YSU9_9GLOM|nr:3608_t:CDS:2 [Ambispora leptoticha]
MLSSYFKQLYEDLKKEKKKRSTSYPTYNQNLNSYQPYPAPTDSYQPYSNDSYQSYTMKNLTYTTYGMPFFMDPESFLPSDTIQMTTLVSNTE